ncbi:MAG: hypothetical protein AB8H79_21095 [Myxococcota bacterium]
MSATASKIWVDGDPVMSLTSQPSPDLSDLRDALRTAAPPGSRVALKLDRDLPASVSLPILHAVLRSGVGSPWLYVLGPTGHPAGIGLNLPVRGSNAADPNADVAADPSSAGWANPTLTLDSEGEITIAAFDRVYDGVVVPCPDDCPRGAPATDLNRVLRRLKLDHPRDRAIRVKPEPDSTVQAMVTTLDASRDDTFTALGSRQLFPTAVVDPRPNP